MGIQMIGLFFLGLAILSQVNCNREGDILHQQKTLWNNPNNVLQSWDPTLLNPCTWFYVTCNGNNTVTRLDLENAQLSGPLSPKLGELKNLQFLVLIENNFTGAIPYELGDLSSLVNLNLTQNSLSGPIPSSLGKIKSLRYLILNGNKLSGNIPEEVLDLVLTGSLIEMNVSDNYFAGTLRSPDKRVTTIIQDQSSRNITI